MKKTLIFLVQLALGIGLIAFFYGKMHSSGELTDFTKAWKDAAANWPILMAGVSLYFICILICTLRWNLLLKSQSLYLPFRRVLALSFVGNFFSAFMPGATTGDVFKAIYVARESATKRAEVVATVFIDRIIGLVGLIILTVAVMLVRLKFFTSYSQTKVVLVFNCILLAGTVVGGLLVFGQNLFERWPLFKRISERTVIGTIIRRVYDAFHICMNHKSLLLKTTALSILNHVVLICCAYFMGKALNIKMDFIDYLSIFPAINAIAAIPFTPGGVGTRDGAAKYLLPPIYGVSVPQALALSMLVYLGMLAWGLVGGVVYFFYSVRIARTSGEPST